MGKAKADFKKAEIETQQYKAKKPPNWIKVKSPAEWCWE
jgi:hypothetical protein